MINNGERRCATWGARVPVVVGGQTIGAVGVIGPPKEADIALVRMGAALIAD